MNDNPAAEDAVRPPIENTVVELPAVAVRTGVFDPHKVVHVLAPGGHEQPVDQALAAFTGQDRVHVVPHQRATEQHRVGRDITATALLQPEGRDAKCLMALALDHIVA